MLVLMQMFATVDRERLPDGRARVLVATPIQPLALLAAIMGALARLAHLEPRLPTTVAMPPWDDDGRDKQAPRVPATHADGQTEVLAPSSFMLQMAARWALHVPAWPCINVFACEANASSVKAPAS